jgi:isorenieratene synthase
MHRRVTQPRAIVVGGGLAGCAAATVLAERGVRVTVIEKEHFLGGRAGAWDDRLADGTPFQMERGFHAFFRQYYAVRSLIRRIDPTLSCLRRLDDYPLLGPGGWSESFASLPRSTPLNLAALVWRTPSMRLRDLGGIDISRAIEMVAFDPDATYARWDRTSASEYLDSLGFPPRARRMLFEVFAHSFFNPEEEYSAAELLAMFHFYFLGNPEGLVFDVMREPFSVALWRPLRTWLEARGVAFQLGTAAHAVRRDGRLFTVEIDGGRIEGDACVLATTVPSLREIVDASRGLGDEAWRARVGSLAVTHPFAVWRMWLDRPMRVERAPFAGTAGLGILDNVSIYEKLEGESAAWARRTGGSIVELHAYAVDPGKSEREIRRELLEGWHEVYPEARDARMIEERFLLRRDCPAFAPGSHESRPGIETPVPGLFLAGDFVRSAVPSALMERAVASGMSAGRAIVASMFSSRGGREREEIPRSIARRGALAMLRGGWSTVRR